MNKGISKDQVISYLREYEMAPIRKLGQNFLTNQDVAESIVGALDLIPSDVVLEIGPGFGALTSQLIERTSRLDLYELDQKMATFLVDHYRQYRGVTVHHQDALKAEWPIYTKVISNLPYYATTAFIEKMYRDAINLKQAVLMIQKEVLPRLIAREHEDGYGPLAILLAHLANITPLFIVKPNSFYPEPPVDSLVINILFKSNINRQNLLKLDSLVRRLFENRRKTILNNLTAVVHDRNYAKTLLEKIGVPEGQRPEDIGLEKYVRLAEIMYD